MKRPKLKKQDRLNAPLKKAGGLVVWYFYTAYPRPEFYQEPKPLGRRNGR